ncbi:Di-copper centre-containing protein [Thozetella sp. PMI_491]|nr:Di-copper centre-containing protein [Thozetella sp. PMI_491]
MWTLWSALLLPSLLAGVGAVEVEGPASGYTPKFKVVRNGNYPLDVVDKLAEATLPKVDAWMAKKIAAGKNNNCTLETAAVRREWSDLTVEQRVEYTTAVKCLMNLPAKADKTRFPGAMSRFDDFVAYHMTHAMQLHDNYHLFGAHKYFLWLYEQALRNECNYTGYQPYENYDRYAQDPIHSPLWNGNASSLGGNGEPDPKYKGVPQAGRNPNIIKTGGGGGCVTSGPFSDMVVSLGPTSMSTVSGLNITKNPRTDGTGANPRCLRRDINRNAAMGATADRAFSLINNNKNIDGFYNQLLGSPPPKNDSYPWGIHTAGHYIHAVDPGGDPNTSPGDPGFYFHHGALDRLWWVWQMQDPDARLNAIPGVSEMNMPGMNHKRVTDPSTIIVDMEWLGPPIKLMETHDPLGGNGGAFCYVYV